MITLNVLEGSRVYERERRRESLRSKLERVFGLTTSMGAIGAYQYMSQVDRNALTPAQIRLHKQGVDAAAVSAMEMALTHQNLVQAFSRGSEGKKEAQFHGELEAADLHACFEGSNPNAMKADMVTDPIDNTESAVLGEPGSISVAAACNHEGIADVDCHYWLSIVVSPRLKEAGLSLTRTPRENMMRAIEYLDIPPQDFSVVILDRPRNQVYIDSARDLGVNLILIKRGDVHTWLEVFIDQ